MFCAVGVEVLVVVMARPLGISFHYIFHDALAAAGDMPNAVRPAPEPAPDHHRRPGRPEPAAPHTWVTAGPRSTHLIHTRGRGVGSLRVAQAGPLAHQIFVYMELGWGGILPVYCSCRFSENITWLSTLPLLIFIIITKYRATKFL